MNSKYAAIVIWLVPVLLVAIISLTNFQTTAVSLFGSTQQLPLGLLPLSGLLIGMGGIFALKMLKSGQQQAEEKKLNNWEAQDAKLIAEVKSDREKQLEAKI